MKRSNAEQIYWAEMEEGKRQFRQYMSDSDVHPAIIVDDILRSGKAIQETFDLCKEIGAEVIGCGVIAKFDDAPNEFHGMPVKSLLSFDVNFYETEEDWKKSRSASESKKKRSDSKHRFRKIASVGRKAPAFRHKPSKTFRVG